MVTWCSQHTHVLDSVCAISSVAIIKIKAHKTIGAYSMPDFTNCVASGLIQKRMREMISHWYLKV